MAWKVQEERGYGINFSNVGERKNTVEFRYANGSKEAETWIENINLFGGIVKAAEDLAIIQTKSEEEKTNEERGLLRAFEVVKDKNAGEEDKLDALLEIIIPNEKDRYMYKERYYENSRLIELNPEFKELFLECLETEEISTNEIMEGVFLGEDGVTGQEYEGYNAGIYWLGEKDKSGRY